VIRSSLWLIFTVAAIFTASGVYSAGFSRPSYHQGFARSPSESQYPNEWEGLIGAWIPSLGPTGDTLYDWSGFDNDGTLTLMDPATDWVIGGNPRLPGYVLDFDGADDSVNAGSPALLDDLFIGGGTLTAWIFPRTLGESDNGRILDKASSTGHADGWAFTNRDAANPRIRFARDWSTNLGEWDSPADSITLNTWQHVAVTYNEGSDQNDAVIYIDGQSVGITENNTPSGSPVTDAAQDFLIGNFSDLRTFDGFIDGVRVYNRELNAAEILSIYQNSLGAFQLRSRLLARAPAAAPVTFWGTPTWGTPAWGTPTWGTPSW